MNPSSQSTSKITRIVHNIGFPPLGNLQFPKTLVATSVGAMAMPFGAKLCVQRITPVNDSFGASRVSGDPPMTGEGKGQRALEPSTSRFNASKQWGEFGSRRWR